MYRDRFGIAIDKDSARRKLSTIVAQVMLIYRPIMVDDLEDLARMNMNQRKDHGESTSATD